MIVERGKRIPRQALVDLIWPNVRNEKHARQRFRQALLRLRECGLPIAGGNGTLLLDRAAAHTDFDTLASPDTIRIGQSLEFLPHYAPRISDRFLDWVETHRSRVHATVQRHFLARMQQARSRGDWGEVDELATECLRLDPYNEEAVMAHAECAVMRGSKREALSILDSYMEALGAQVGTIGLPAKILRTRIAERLTDQRYAMISEQHFVGREASMELLLGLLREAKRGAGSAALIWGEPGIGKSRLVQELTQVAALDDAQIVSTKCHPTDAGRPLSAFADFVPMLKTLPGALGCSAQTLSLLQRLTDRNKSDAFPPQEAGDAAFLAATIRRAVFDLVDAVADEGMLVMVIEDVHWLDEPSWAILSAMVEWSTTRTLLILMTSRTAHATETKVADPDRGLHRHHLLPLTDADSGALLDKLAADDANPLPASVREWSVAAAEGNPFYLRELVRHWVETQQGFGVPRSLAELIEARLNRLSSLALRVLQLCAGFGKHSSFERLEKATGYRNHMLLDAIEELSSAAMLAADIPGVAVKHDLLATAALNRLGSAASRLVHRQVATVLEAEVSEKHTVALMWDCAEHWQCAGDTPHALATVRICAHQLHAVGHVNQAVELYERALHICSTAEERMDTILNLAVALKSADSWIRLRELLAETDVDSVYLPIAAVRYHLSLLKLETTWRLQRRSKAGVADFVRFASDQSKDTSLRLQAVRLGLVSCAEGRHAEEAQCLFRMLDDLEVDTDHAENAEHIRMIFHTDFGDMDQALVHADRLLALESRSSGLTPVPRTRLNVAVCYRRGGRMAEAKSLARGTFDFATDHGLGAHAAWAAMTLAYMALQEDDFEEARVWHTRAVDQARSIDDKSCRDGLDYIRARIALHEGDL
ncbi:MAG: AAA family ATPase, partial [Gemmatimonadaceae bacterium]|nr:AAA family ATPase [Gemmatimonadaceae bacterium]